MQTTAEKRELNKASIAAPTIETPSAAEGDFQEKRPRRVLATGRWLSFSIGEDSLEISVASRRGKTAVLHEAKRINIGRDFFSDVQRDDHICSLISDLISQFGGFQPRLAVVLSGTETVLRTFDMPELKGGKLDSAIRFEARKRIPFPVSDCILDYRVLGRFKSKQGNRLRIALLAATKRLVNQQLNYFRRLNLTVEHVYISYDVISQIMARLPSADSETVSALISVDRGILHMAYYRGKQLEFFHVTSLAATDSPTQAESGDVRFFTQQVARDIQTSLDYYAGQFAQAETSQLFIYGDMAHGQGLVEILEDDYGFSFDDLPAEGLQGIKTGRGDLIKAIAVCLPTVAASVCNRKLANLLPPEQKVRKSRKQAVQWSAAVLLCLIAGLTMISYAQNYRLNQLENSLWYLNAEIEAFRVSPVFDTYNEIKRQIAQNRTYIERISRSPSYLGPSLKELTRLVPAGVRLHVLDFEVETSGNAVNMTGTVSSDNVPPELVLAEFVESLKRSPFYDSVTVQRHVKRAVGDRFELEFQLAMRGVV